MIGEMDMKSEQQVKELYDRVVKEYNDSGKICFKYQITVLDYILRG